MEQWKREFYVARIVAGRIAVKVNGLTLYISSPSREQKYMASEVYRSVRAEAEFDGAYSDKELVDVLIRQGIWGIAQAEEVEKLKKAVEDLKVGLFENRIKSNAKLTIRTALKKTKNELLRLENIRHSMDHLTIDGLASLSRFRFIIGCSIRYSNDTAYWNSSNINLEDELIDKVIDELGSERIGEADYRELARSEPWRSLWGTKNHSGKGLFNCASVDLTEEQQSIVLWSSIYDSIKEYPESPGDDIIEDDDMLDGWMIIQRRERENKSVSQEGDRIGNDKIRNSDEQFIFVDTFEDAQKIDKMNDPVAAMVKSQRMNHLKQSGSVKEQSMPDQQQRVAMEFNRLEQMKLRQGK